MNADGSACAKAILFGEHASVYSHPAIAAPLPEMRADVFVLNSPVPESLLLESKNLDINCDILKNPLGRGQEGYALQETIFNTLKFLNLPKKIGLHIIIDSQIPVASGLGSGAAVSIALIRALASHFSRQISLQDLVKIASESEVMYHGTPSGIDIAVIANQKPILFQKGAPPKIELLKVKGKIPLVIASTGIHSKTRDVVLGVRNAWERHKEKYEKIFSQISSIVSQARPLMESGDIAQLGPLMDQNHALLQQINVSCPELDALVGAARAAGALGAKLVGAGRGGSMIALVNGNGDQKQVSQALIDAGAQNVHYVEIS